MPKALNHILLPNSYVHWSLHDSTILGLCQKQRSLPREACCFSNAPVKLSTSSAWGCVARVGGDLYSYMQSFVLSSLQDCPEGSTHFPTMRILQTWQMTISGPCLAVITESDETPTPTPIDYALDWPSSEVPPSCGSVARTS
ncbi:hypothetical protein TREES_T100010497 [Tupaia chinensis]|uniref:Uncharacterized protein n=1 Tax=Tupaia chinensis TaxID=246437 RepID=L9LBA4_TUPCH|nr:hypothetical protein TREES_T100010497 [Tupaia chinensis]